MSCLCMPRLETHVKIAGFCVEHSDGKTFSHSHLRRRVGSGTTQRCPLSVHYIYHIRYSRHLGIYTRYSKLTNHKAYKHLQNLQKHQVFKEGFRAPLRGRGHGRGWVLWSAGRSCCFGEGLRRGHSSTILGSVVAFDDLILGFAKRLRLPRLPRLPTNLGCRR